MEGSTPKELARLLNITLDGRPGTPRTTESSETAAATAELIGSHVRGIQEPEVFVEELASLYLPSLVRSFLALETFYYDDDPLQYRLTSYFNVLTIVSVGHTSALPRFAREFPDEASSLFLKHLDLATTIWSELVVPEIAPDVATLLESILGLLMTLVDHLPTTSAFPSLGPESQRSLQTLTDGLLNHNLRSELEGLVFTRCRMKLESFALLLRRLAAGELGVRSLGRGIDLDTRVGAVWLACEYRFKGEESTRVQMKEGEEMMACSKCLAVRYCSREHQKADWKRHKRLCFKPSW